MYTYPPSDSPAGLDPLNATNADDKEVLEIAAVILTGYVWFLLEAYNLMPEGSFTFPDGETWTSDELAQFKETYKHGT